MAPPPAKRQKLIVLSSDDDEAWATPAERHHGKPTRGLMSKTSTKQTATNGTTQKSLPTRFRRGPTDSNDKSEPTAKKQTSLEPSPKKPTHRPKVAAKPQASKPISSFFNATTRIEEINGKRKTKEEKPQVEEEDLDQIEDDYPLEDVGELRGEKDTTRLVLDRRKAPFMPTQSASSSTQRQILLAGSQRFKIAGSAKGKSRHMPGPGSAALSNDDLRPWAEKYGPSNLEELVVHKKKVSDVRGWLENVLQGRIQKRLLILRGPSGAGKTATIFTLAKAMDFDLSEWRNPVGSEYSSEGYFSMSAQFDEFLGRSGKFGQLSLGGSVGKDDAMPPSAADATGESTKRKVILLEEFPNTCLSASSTLRSFRSSVLRYLAVNSPSMGAQFSDQHCLNDNVTPVIMSITETRLTTTTAASDSFTAHRLLSSEILSHPGVSIIDFNPIAPTLLTKALNLVIQKEASQSGRRRIPRPSVLRKLGDIGDVRSAIESLEFLCLRGEDGQDWGDKVASKASEGAKVSTAFTGAENESLEILTQRESSLGLFHAVGKVVYNKRNVPNADVLTEAAVQQPPEHLSKYARLRVSQVSVDQLIGEIGTDTGTFVAALHENYILSCEGSNFIDTINGCLDGLSDSDLLSSPRGGQFGSSGNFGGLSFHGAASDSVRQDEICFQLAVRGLLFALPDPVKRCARPIGGKSTGKNDTFKMFYPASMRLLRQMEEIDSLVDGCTDRMKAGVANVEYRGSNHGNQFATPQLKATKSASISLGRGDELESRRTGPTCTKKELILERLPYVTKIEQCKLTSTYLNDLQKITEFHSVNTPDSDISDEDTLDDAYPSTKWTTDHPTDGKPGTSVSVTTLGQRGEDAKTLALANEEEMGKLFLTDDDIEDD